MVFRLNQSYKIEELELEVAKRRKELGLSSDNIDVPSFRDIEDKRNKKFTVQKKEGKEVPRYTYL